MVHPPYGDGGGWWVGHGAMGYNEFGEDDFCTMAGWAVKRSTWLNVCDENVQQIIDNRTLKEEQRFYGFSVCSPSNLIDWLYLVKSIVQHILPIVTNLYIVI